MVTHCVAASDYSGHVHLKTLTLRGFKSFAVSTTLRFEPGINVVVGPNGSGKSNVVDALAWVMGEQGVKQLRGGQMADVIFAGTSKRPPLGRAEVSLTIDNSDGALPIDYSEVTISRTIFRTGGSEYAINGAPCRLLDIQELLSDTGMGREMHVIIGQGKLDEVLTATAEDRRGFIEEAAGVLKHRRRKEKALRKLDKMAGSLTRLEDLTAELRRQLGPLARQAEAARKAQIIQAEVRDARSRLLADDIALQQARMHAGSVDEAKLNADIEANTEATGAARTRVAELERAAAHASPELANLAEQWERLTSLEERFRSLGQLAAERQRSLSMAPVSQVGEAPEQIRARATEAREQETHLKAEVSAEQDALRVAIDVREKAESTSRELDRELAELQRKAADRREDAARLGGQINTATSRIEALEDEAARVEAALKAAQARATEASEQVARLEEEIVASTEADSSVVQAHEESARILAQAQAILVEARAAEQAARESLATWTTKADTLALSLEPEDASAWAASQSQTLVQGLLRDCLTVTSGWESAAEAALEGAATGVLATDIASAVDLLRAARDEEAGHLEISIAASASEPTATAASRAEALEKAFAGASIEADAAVRARDAVRATKPAAGAIAELLAGIALATDLHTARKLVEAGAPLVATIAGDVLTATRAWGGEATQASLLARQSACDEARREAEAAAIALKQAGEVLAEAEAAVEQAAEDNARSSAEMNARDSRLAALSAELGVLRQTREAAAGEVERSQQRAARITEDLAARREELEVLRARHKASQVQPEELAVAVEQVSKSAEAAQLDVREARQKETESRLSLRTLEERLRAIAGRSDSLERKAREAEERIEREQRAAIRRAEAAAVADRVGEHSTRALNAARALRGEVGQARAQAEAQRSVRETELAGARRTVDTLLAARRDLENVAHQRELALAEQRLRLEQLEARAIDELGVEAAILVKEFGPLNEVPMPTDKDPHHTVAFVREEQEQRLAKAERQLARLGLINPLALEEHKALEERAQYLAGQLADLKASRDDLLSMIREIDEKMDEVLRSALADVSERFSEVFATLFPGGQGRLVLTEPDSPLTTGIDIEARPPGKKVKRLSLLSGGERSLTAIAFLIAIFMARPSPFYVMDEVEAALDDVNLSRLLGIFSQLQASSQLLVITHQKRTMEIADTIYGMAMREQGVTSVVSQRLADIAPKK